MVITEPQKLAYEHQLELGRALAAENAQLRAEIKQQPVINTDDTGWRVAGERAHLMAFESATTTV